MLTFDQITYIVSRIEYRPGWCVIVNCDLGPVDATLEQGRPYIQIVVSTESEASLSPFTGEREAWKSGKHYLSYHMCRQEIVGAVFGAIKAAEEHEMREWFSYRGARTYNPHLDPDVLAEVARKRSSFDFRENAMTMDEKT